MPINLDLQPDPQFERSLLQYASINFHRIKDAFRKSLGDYQTGVESFVFAAQVSIQKTITFPTLFTQSTGPLVVVTPIDNLAFPGMHSYVTRATPASAIVILDSLGGAVTGTATVRWVAFYP